MVLECKIAVDGAKVLCTPFHHAEVKVDSVVPVRTIFLHQKDTGKSATPRPKIKNTPILRGLEFWKKVLFRPNAIEIRVGCPNQLAQF